jgi:arylsulfatase A-like enzyme
VDAAIAQLDAFGTDRFFVWLHVQDPHGPYTPPEAAVEALPMASELPLESGVAAPTRRLPPGQNHSGYRAIPRYQYLGSQLQLSDYIRLYDAEIRHLDESLGRLFRYLEGEGRARDTLVAITADHGEAFGEDDYFCAHGHGIGIDQTRVPLAFVGPGIAPGGVLSTPVSNIDLFATLLEALGELEGPPVDSASLLRNLREGTEPKGRLGYAESVTQRAVISNGLYFRRDVRALDDHDFWESRNPYTGALYRPLKSLRFTSLKKDVTVERSAANAKQLPKRTKSLAVSLDAFESRVAAMESKLAATRENADSGALTDEEEEELRELGYLE